MQTFLLDKDHNRTSFVLDMRRLCKQRLESIQLMDVLLKKANLLKDNKNGWNFHVAVNYWFSEEGNWLPCLIDYTQIMIDEWIRRGYKNTINLNSYRNIVQAHPALFKFENPPWVTYSDLIIESHRARVLQKDYNYYSEVFHEQNIPFPENWENMEYKWMKLTQKQEKESKQGKIYQENNQLFRKESFLM